MIQQNIFTPCILYLKVSWVISDERIRERNTRVGKRGLDYYLQKATKLTYQWSRTGSINFMRHMAYALSQPVTTKNSQKTFLNRMEEYGFEFEMVYQNKLTLSNPMKLVEADLKGQLINYQRKPNRPMVLG